MQHAIKVGFNFGVTSSIITTLGLMIGLNSVADSRLVVIGGVLTIAIADALADALGIHISEESETVHSTKQIWISTISTFIFKFIFTIAFIIPLLLFSLDIAIKVSALWGLLILSILSYKLGRINNKNPWFIVAEHLLIAFVVIILTHFIGSWVAVKFC